MGSDTESVIRQLDLMGDAALPVVQQCRIGLEVVSDWLDHVDKPSKMTTVEASGLPQTIAALQQALDGFKTNRLQILLPFRHLFDPNHPPIDLTYKVCTSPSIKVPLGH